VYGYGRKLRLTLIIEGMAIDDPKAMCLPAILRGGRKKLLKE
jgi:hypothetical protein